MKLRRLMATLVLGLGLVQPATAQAEQEASRARTKLHLELERHPLSWQQTADDELQNPNSGLRCSAVFSGFGLTSISTLSFLNAPQNGVMCEWTRSSDSAGILVAVLEAGSHSLREVTQTATKASTLGGTRPEVLPVDISYNGCPATRFDVWEGDGFKSRMTIVQKGGYFWTLATRGRLPVTSEGAKLGSEDVHGLADDYVRSQLICEPLG